MATASVTNSFTNGLLSDAGEMNTNFTDLVTFLNNSVVHVDGSKGMTGALDLNLNGIVDAGSIAGINANLAMGSNKVTGLAAASANGDAVRYEQVLGVVTTAGDLLVASGSGALTRLGLGSGDQYLKVNAGATALEFAALPPLSGKARAFVKTSNETINSDTTLTADNTLVASVEASKEYAFKFVVRYASVSLADFKFEVTHPTGATYEAFYATGEFPNPLGDLNAIDDTTAPISLTGPTVTDNYIIVEGALVVSTTAGDLSFEWAQNSSDAGDTTVLAKSMLTIIEAE